MLRHLRELFHRVLSMHIATWNFHILKSMIPERTGLIDFVFNIVTQRHFAEEEILQAIERAETK